MSSASRLLPEHILRRFRCRSAGQWLDRLKHLRRQRQRHQCGSRRDHRQTKLLGQTITEGRSTNFWNRLPTGRDHQRLGGKMSITSYRLTPGKTAGTVTDGPWSPPMQSMAMRVVMAK